jgi:hypothetical protein
MKVRKRFPIEAEIGKLIDERREKCDRLTVESAKFFARANSDRAESQEFQTASLRTLQRD